MKLGTELKIIPMKDWLKDYWYLPIPNFKDYGLSGVLLILAFDIGKIILFPLIFLMSLGKYIPFVASKAEEIKKRR